MNCRTCPYLRRNCGGLKGNPGHELPSIDPMPLSSEQLLQFACALARVGTVLCDLGGVSGDRQPKMTEEPYIWDTEED